MSHIRKGQEDKKYTPEQKKKLLQEPRWQYAKDQVDHEVLEANFNFLNQGVVTRGDAEGIPLMTTRAIYGPIAPHDTVQLHQAEERTVNVVSTTPIEDKEKHLLHQLKHLKANAKRPEPELCVQVHAKWVSGQEGGGLPGLDKSSNVFGITGSLLINETDIEFPIIDKNHPKFNETLAYYGAKLLKPKEEFYMGFDKPLFGMEYDTSLPGYIQDYVMKPYGGGGLFVEHHPFPHIWFPNPTDSERETNICRILLGRVVPENELQLIEQKIDYLCDGDTCTLITGKKTDPKYRFTVFQIPTDGHAVAVDECCIHNDSFCNGRQVVFLADTKADTVALREAAPFENLRVNYVNPPLA
ncbi:MAG: hypothetical protein AAFX87_28640 [Bacteroidota bacterium]